MTGRRQDVENVILEWAGHTAGYKVLSSADCGSRPLIQGVACWMKGG
jgi:hypothetical protein